MGIRNRGLKLKCTEAIHLLKMIAPTELFQMADLVHHFKHWVSSVRPAVETPKNRRLALKKKNPLFFFVPSFLYLPF